MHFNTVNVEVRASESRPPDVIDESFAFSVRSVEASEGEIRERLRSMLAETFHEVQTHHISTRWGGAGDTLVVVVTVAGGYATLRLLAADLQTLMGWLRERSSARLPAATEPEIVDYARACIARRYGEDPAELSLVAVREDVPTRRWKVDMEGRDSYTADLDVDRSGPSLAAISRRRNF